MTHSRFLHAISLASLLAFAACSDDTEGPTPDTGVPDMSKADSKVTKSEAGAKEASVPDKGPKAEASVKEAGADGPAPDMAQPDMAPPDMMKADVIQPDKGVVYPDLNLSDGMLASKACTKAKSMSFSAGKATATGSISSTRKDNDVSFTDTKCTGQKQPGAEDIHRIQLVAGKPYMFSVVPSSSYNQGVYLLNDCAQPLSACVAGADTQYSGSTETFTYVPKTTGTYWVGVDSRYTAGSSLSYGTYTLTVSDLGTVTTGDYCTKPLPLTWSAGKATATGTTKTGFNAYFNLSSYGCTYYDTEGVDVFYRAAVTKGKVYKVKVTPGSGWYASVYALSSCSTKSCIGGSDYGTSSGGPSEFTFTAATTGNVILGVDSRYASTSSLGKGTYTLEISEVTPSKGEFCNSPTALTFSGGVVSVSGDTTAATNDMVMGYNSCVGDDTIGPDQFYSFQATKGKGYIVETTGTSFDSAIYVLTSCSINSCVAGADASSSSSTGEKLAFVAKTSGTYIVGVDSDYKNDKGTYTLKITEYTPPTNDICSGAKAITMTAGKGTITGDTTKATPSVNLPYASCVGDDTEGPDLFYSFMATAGKSYKITATPASTYNVNLYAFTTCGSENSTCIKGADLGYNGVKESIKFTAKTSGKVYIGVDSDNKTSTNKSGTFTLDVEQYTAPVNEKCSGAQLVTLTGGKVTVSGDTDKASDEFTTLQCKTIGSTSTTSNLDGNQLYYKWATVKDQWYKLVLSPKDNSQYLYVFSNPACTQSAISTDCQSAGKDGGAIGSVGTTYKRAMYFKAKSTGFAYFAVDSLSTGGKFTVDLEEITPPDNSTCAKAKAITLTNDKAKVRSDVGPLLTPDEYSTLKCYSSVLFDGPQVYFSVGLTAGKNYLMSLDADSASGLYGYVFTDVCGATKIQTDCGSSGSTGAVTSSSTGTSGTTMMFKPTTSGTYKIGVDSTAPSSFGGFTLDISTLKANTNTTCQTAQSLTLTGGKATVSGFKTAADGDNMKKCGTVTLASTDLFYKFTPTIGKKYKLTFKPQGSGGRWSVWDGNHNCDATKLATECGKIGYTFVTGGSTSTKTITSAVGDIYFIADGCCTGTYDTYKFQFDIEELP